MYAQPHTDGSRIYLQARDFFEVKANDVSKAKAEDPPLSTLRTFKLNSTSEITILVNQRDQMETEIQVPENGPHVESLMSPHYVRPQQKQKTIPHDTVQWAYGNEAAFPQWPSMEKSVPFLNMVAVSLKSHFFDAP